MSAATKIKYDNIEELSELQPSLTVEGFYQIAEDSIQRAYARAVSGDAAPLMAAMWAYEDCALYGPKYMGHAAQAARLLWQQIVDNR